MLDEQTPAQADDNTTETNADNAGRASAEVSGAEATPPPRKRAARKSTAKKTTAPAAAEASEDAPAPAKKTTTRKTAAKRTTKKAAAAPVEAPVEPVEAPAEAAGAEAPAAETSGASPEIGENPAAESTPAAKRAPRKRTAKKTTSRPPAAAGEADSSAPADESVGDAGTDAEVPSAEQAGGTTPLFQPPAPARATKAAAKRTAKKTVVKRAAAAPDASDEELPEAEDGDEVALDETTVGPLAENEDGADNAEDVEDSDVDDSDADDSDVDDADDSDGDGAPRRRRRRGGRRRRRGGSGGGGQGAVATDGEDSDDAASAADGDEESAAGEDDGDNGASGTSRRRRRRRRAGEGGEGDAESDPDNTVTRVRKPRTAEDEITGFTGSTRLEAKKQRRREGREAGRRRAPIISEAEFLARRESVERRMVVRQRGDLTQIAVLEDKVLVEHYVARESQTSLIGNVYLGRVQNVLPSMEAAFVDIGKGRNAVLYAGEVNWDALGAKDGGQRKIEQVLKSGQSVLVQVTKDPIGHKGARLTSQISLPGRFLVYVPDGTTSGISRKLPDKERTRLKTLLKEIVPDEAGVIVRTAAEGADEKELIRDVERLKALWEDITKKVESGNAPQLLYGEPDLTLKVVRDLFTEDIDQLVVSGEDAWEMVDNYVRHIAPDLVDRLEKHDDSQGDAFAAYRIDEQIAKALDRKVFLPSGGSLVIDRTEAMTVVDVNTGKFTGSGGNLEETVTKNNLEAAEEIVRQLRLRDIGGIIVVDFIDMVLESNRDLVLRRLVECLGRDRTRHQVAEVTSLGLVQMTRKRIGTGLLEAFSEPCEHCAGRGLTVHHEPVAPSNRRTPAEEEPRRGRRNRGRGKGDDAATPATEPADKSESADQSGDSPRRPTPAEFAAMARAEKDSRPTDPAPEAEAEPVVEPGQAPEPEPTPAAVSAPEPPRIVTSVRRISARRPAGPPAGTTPTVESPSQAPMEESVEEPTAQQDTGVLPGETAETVTDPVTDGVTDGGQVHVPVKKKGARKR